MTHTDYTKLILNIKDNNIYFNENCLEIVKLKLPRFVVITHYL